MRKRLTYISPLQLGIVLALVYGLVSLIAVPFLILGALIGHPGPGTIFVIFLPILYAIAGFIGGLITAVIYNVVANWTGGIEFIVTDSPQGA